MDFQGAANAVIGLISAIGGPTAAIATTAIVAVGQWLTESYRRKKEADSADPVKQLRLDGLLGNSEILELKNLRRRQDALDAIEKLEPWKGRPYHLLNLSTALASAGLVLANPSWFAMDNGDISKGSAAIVLMPLVSILITRFFGRWPIYTWLQTEWDKNFADPYKQRLHAANESVTVARKQFLIRVAESIAIPKQPKYAADEAAEDSAEPMQSESRTPSQEVIEQRLANATKSQRRDAEKIQKEIVKLNDKLQAEQTKLLTLLDKANPPKRDMAIERARPKLT